MKLTLYCKLTIVQYKIKISKQFKVTVKSFSYNKQLFPTTITTNNKNTLLQNTIIHI